MALYEHVFLARQDLAQAQVDALAATATSIIEDNGGKVLKTETWGLRSLAYKIAKNRKAHYVMLEFSAPGPVVAELERQTQINEDVIRYMTIKIDDARIRPVRDDAQEDRAQAASATATTTAAANPALPVLRRFDPWHVRFSAAASPAPFRGKDAPRIDYKDVVCFRVSSLNAARSSPPHHQPFRPRSSASCPRPSSAPAIWACCPTS
jgi:small subunit ribosomal protein S6